MKFFMTRQRGARRQRSADDPPPPREEQAYLLLEETRLRFLRLRQPAGGAAPSARPWIGDGQESALEVIYREIGLAGYMASSHIPSDRRLRLLAVARERSGQGRGGDSGLRALMQVAAAAAQAIEQALVAPGFTDHLQTAGEHLMRARLALGDATAAGAAAAASTVHG